MKHPAEKLKFLEFIVKLCQGFGEQFRNIEHYESELKFIER